MAKDALKMRWEVVGSSIRTMDAVGKRFDISGRTVQVHLDVAFNIGEQLANHIVQLHNKSLDICDHLRDNDYIN